MTTGATCLRGIRSGVVHAPATVLTPSSHNLDGASAYPRQVQEKKVTDETTTILRALLGCPVVTKVQAQPTSAYPTPLDRSTLRAPVPRVLVIASQRRIPTSAPMSFTAFSNMRRILVSAPGTPFVDTKAAAPSGIRKTATMTPATSVGIMSAKSIVIIPREEPDVPSHVHHGQLAKLTARASSVREGVTFATSITGTADLTLSFESTGMLLRASWMKSSPIIHTATPMAGRRAEVHETDASSIVPLMSKPSSGSLCPNVPVLASTTFLAHPQATTKVRHV